MKRIVLALVLAAGVLVLALIVVNPTLFSNAPSPAKPSASFDDPRAWRSIGRAPVLNTSFDLPRAQTWQVTSLPPLPNVKGRFTLSGSFTASEPVAFVVIDPDNVLRMNTGYPPLIAYRSAGNVSTVYPVPGSMWGFVRPSPVQASGIPTSASALALRLIALAAEESRPAARVTADIHVDGECFCTDAEAARLRH